jgi:hypothetical protein
MAGVGVVAGRSGGWGRWPMAGEDRRRGVGPGDWCSRQL